MFNYNNTSILFLWVLAFYFIPMVIGFTLGKIKSVKLTRLSEIGKTLTDPVTLKIHNWSRKYKMACIKEGKWIFLFILILLNNLILVAFVTRVLYGIVFLVPLFLNAYTGFGHGVIFSRPRGRTGIVLILEFAGYLYATAIGVKVGIDIMSSLILGRPIMIIIPWQYVLPMVVFLIIGALMESISIKLASKNIDLSNIDNKEFEERKNEIVKLLEEKQ